MRDLNAVLASIDQANTDDPNLVDGEPRARVEGQRATDFVTRLVEQPTDELLIAARAHHLRRWELPRADYPAGRAGYLRWRAEQKRRHAAAIASLMAEGGYDESAIARTQTLLLRTELRTDADTQTLEDAACLVFLEVQFEATAARLGDEHTIAVLRRTISKMSPEGVELATGLALGSHTERLLEAASS